MKHFKININKYETNSQEILKNIEFTLNEKDKIALVGGNGVGKSTLMKVLIGEIKDYDGKIENIGNMSLGYLAQIYNDDETITVRQELKNGFKDIIIAEKLLTILEEKMQNNPDDMTAIEEYSLELERFNYIGGYNYNTKIHNIASGMGVLDLLDRRLCEVSGGQRTKIALCKTLIEEPDILLLDEPTNFIDMAGVEWLEQYLTQKWRGGYFIISHDREFLDRTCNTTYELQPVRQINFYHTNYSGYVVERHKIEDKKMEEYQRQQEFIKKEEDLINRFRAGSRAGFAQSRIKALDRLEKIEPPYIPKKPKFFFEYCEESNHKILHFKEVFIGRKDPLFFIQELNLIKKDRIAIVGENGVGKSTFIKTIIGQLEILDGLISRGKGLRYVYYSQLHEELDKNKTIQENFLDHNICLSEQQLIGLLHHYLIPREDINRKVCELSGGQISKVLFAILGQKESNVLILDEPTNHLDYDTREALEDCLKKYNGTILFISHDRYFVNKLATNLWIIEDNELKVSYGNYEDYRYKVENGIEIEANLIDMCAEMDSVLVDKLGEKEAKRIKEKYSRKK